MTHIRIIATDLDGTLIHSGGEITPRNRKALQRARDAGIEVAICTGRRHSFALRAVRRLALPADSIVISSNGAVTRTIGGDLLWRSTIPLAVARRICSDLSEFRNGLVLTFDMLGTHGQDVAGALVLEELDHLHSSIQSWMEVNAMSIRRVVPIEQIFADPAATEPIQAMFCGSLQRIRRLEQIVRESLCDDVDTFRTEYPGRDLCILDILPKGKSKGAALLQLASARGVAPGQILAIGDNWNDEPMLRVAGHSVVMANAPQDLRSHALAQHWQIGAAGDEDGVAIAVEAALAGNWFTEFPDRNADLLAAGAVRG